MLTTKDLLALDRKLLWHPYASTRTPYPANLAASASGTRIHLADGTELIDAVSSWWCVCHGHNHPAIVEAVRRQAEKLMQIMFAGFTHKPAIHLAELLTAALPPRLNKVFFSDSGSVSVECALKMALQYQYARGERTRNRFATVRGGYHGDTIGAMSVSDPEGMHQMFEGVLGRHFFAPRPAVRFTEAWDPAAFEPMETLLERHGNEIAAVILEPVFQGANAMNFYHPEYLRMLREATRERGILLILDEVATGFGRTGKFFAMHYANITPDILCVGKGLTGGAITLAATVASEEVADAISAVPPGKFMHGPTFMANPLACAAGCASLELFNQYDWAGNVAAIEAQLRRELETLRPLENVADVRALGAVGVVELKRTPTPETVQEIVLQTGVWLRPFGNWLYTMPPFITTPAEITTIVNAMREIASRH